MTEFDRLVAAEAARDALRLERDRLYRRSGSCDECQRKQEAAEAASARLRAACQQVLETFRRDEAQGYHSRDRQYAIELLSQALGAGDAAARPGEPAP